MTLQPLRGFRDFYPEDQFKINYLRQKIAETCRLFGYEEYDGPALEPLELYGAKSSDEIVNEQAFTFADRGGEQIVLRPELTPTLARMIAQKQRELAFPQRLWSFGRFWRYERPQKGRGREFFQWNCDIIGHDSLEAELEILSITITFLQSLGLNHEKVTINVSDRTLLESIFLKAGITAEQAVMAFRFIDRSPKLNEQERDDFARSLGLKTEHIQHVLGEIRQLSHFEALPQESSLAKLFTQLKERDLDKWISINLAVTRGFNYYTGFVFEVRDTAGMYRSLFGGGRYENLVAQIGGQPVSGIGFGMGDMVLLSLLEEVKLLPSYRHPAKAVVITLESSDFTAQTVEEIRNQNIATVVFSGPNSLSPGLRFANRNRIPFALIIGPDEIKQQSITFKSLETSTQDQLSLDEVVQRLV